MSDPVIVINKLSKSFRSYANPADRLSEMFWNGLSLVAPRKYFASLQARALKQADSFWAVDNISFSVNKGETVGIIGRNGSGKSTLLQLICGTLTPTLGEVQVNGRLAALLELGSGFNPEYTGRENVYLNAQLLGLSRAQIDERFDDIAAFADIGRFLELPTKTYSSGMTVRLAFAVIAHVDADVLVIDEALAVGDAFFTQKCMRFLRKFMLDHTVLFVSHDTGSVKGLCSRAVWLEKGRVLESGSPKRVTDLYLEAFFEEKHGKSTSTKLKTTYKKENLLNTDQRQQFINHSNLRNDLKVFRFDEGAASFGLNGGRIIDVEFLDHSGHGLSWIVGGESVRLKITAELSVDFQSPIMGFYVKDKLGQNLFGDNTYLSYADNSISARAGEMLVCQFDFYMPILAMGDYSIAVALADGDQVTHVHHHWIHDALIFKAEAGGIATGLIGIPMTKIQLATAPMTRHTTDA
jgi:lipopolysaccharide transport system ATP-binding protein